MKRIASICALGIAALALASCGTLGGMVADAVLGGSVAAPAPSGGSSYEAPKVAEFRSGEILASEGEGSMAESWYRVATVQQEASAATKNQTQVLFLDGSKAWANYVIQSRKATKGDIKIGATVLYLAGWENNKEADPESYRKSYWLVGTVTNDDELFKDMVEVNGYAYGIALLRIPTSPIKE
jgi:hypothetical protein